MTVRIHVFYQVLMLVLHGLNYLGPFTPPKAVPFVAFGLTVCQAALGLYNHFFTPDGNRIQKPVQ